MASTRYLVLRYRQLRAKLYASSCSETVFAAADDAEMRRVYSELMRRRS